MPAKSMKDVSVLPGTFQRKASAASRGRRWKCVITFPTDRIVAVGRTKDGRQRQRDGNSGGGVGWREGASAGLPGIPRNSSWLQPLAAQLSAPASSFYSPACLKDKTGASDKCRLIRNSAKFSFKWRSRCWGAPTARVNISLQITCARWTLEADSLGAKQTAWQSVQVSVSVWAACPGLISNSTPQERELEYKPRRCSSSLYSSTTIKTFWMLTSFGAKNARYLSHQPNRWSTNKLLCHFRTVAKCLKGYWIKWWIKSG